MDNDVKQVDKRKAPDRDSTGASESSTAEAPLKRPRIHLTRLKESSGSSRKESGTSLGKRSTNAGSSKSTRNEKSGSGGEGKEKPKQQLTEKDKVEVENDNSGNFFAEIMQREERVRSNDGSSLDDVGSEEEKDKPIGSDKNKKRGKKASVMSESDVSPDESLNLPLQLTLRVEDQTRQKCLINQMSIQTDYNRLSTFFKDHGHDLSTLTDSGYTADVSSMEYSDKFPNRISWNSLGSTIQRESLVSISSSSTGGNLTNQLGKSLAPPISGRGRKRGVNDRSPIISSTKLEEFDESEKDEKRDLSNLSNGDDHSPNGVTSQGKIRGKAVKGGKLTPIHPELPVKIESTQNTTPRGRGRPPKNKLKSTPSATSSPALSGNVKTEGSISEDKSTPTSNENFTPKTSKSGGTRGRKPKSAQKKSDDSASPSEDRSDAANDSLIGLDSATGKKKAFEVDRLTDDEITNLVKSSTLWGTIKTGEPVFARWRDKNYYSGVIMKKGLNDTWIIAFEDGMEDVASESHIVPVRIIGIEVCGVYSPDGVYKPFNAVVVGQKFVEWNDKAESVKQAQSVMYAIKCPEFSTPIWCSRKQLSIKENDAKELRKEFSPNCVVAKAADINLVNLVKGPRMRSTGATAATTPKIVGGAFDASSADDSVFNASNLTPLRRIGTPSQVAITEETTESTPVDASKESRLNTKEVASLDSTDSKPESTGRKPGRPRKQLFDGLQFFLTASGGGDPSCDIDVAIPYDKTEFKEDIEKNGGNVIDTVSMEKGTTNVYLISDSHARTVKYIYCLAGGIPCVSYEWIKKCLEMHRIVDWVPFRLNSGYSLEKDAVIERHTQKPLKGMKIYVTAASEELYNYWKPVLTAAQAILLKPNKKMLAIPPEAQVLVTDASCSTVLLNMANEERIPIVKPEWLVQTIITGEKADFFGHERYIVPTGVQDVVEEENNDHATTPRSSGQFSASMYSSSTE